MIKLSRTRYAKYLADLVKAKDTKNIARFISRLETAHTNEAGLGLALGDIPSKVLEKATYSLKDVLKAARRAAKQKSYRFNTLNQAVSPPKLTASEAADLMPFAHGTTLWSANRMAKAPWAIGGSIDGLADGRNRRLRGLMVHTPEQNSHTFSRAFSLGYPQRAAGDWMGTGRIEEPGTLFGMIPRKLLQTPTNGYERGIPSSWLARYGQDLKALPAGPGSAGEAYGNALNRHAKTYNMLNSLGQASAKA